MGNSILHPTSTHLAYFWWTILHEKQEIHEKCDVDVIITFFPCISCFSWSRVRQKYAKWVLVGCRIEFPIQWVLLIEIWVKPDGDKLKIWVEKVVFSLVYFFTQKNGDSSPMVDIITLNPIGSYKVDFCCTFLFWGLFFTSKFL